MKKEPKFFICKHCGNLVTFVHESGAPLSCCGDLMTQVVPNTVEAATEKHIPVVTIGGNKVSISVGSVEHPMTQEHFIQWVYLETDKGLQVKALKPGDKPNPEFELVDETAISVYAYCNLHGLWRTMI